MEKDQNYLMVTVSGQDRPGIAAAFTNILSEHHVKIMDIEQASPQDLLGLYFLLDLSSAANNKDSVIKDLLFEANQLGLNLHCGNPRSASDEAWGQAQESRGAACQQACCPEIAN